MKKSILVGCSAIILVFMTSSFVQSNSLRQDAGELIETVVSKTFHADGVMMTTGMMKLVKNGKVTIMVADITMSDGTRVRMDGTIIKTDKTRAMMTDGQHMDLAGTITEMNEF